MELSEDFLGGYCSCASPMDHIHKQCPTSLDEHGALPRLHTVRASPSPPWHTYGRELVDDDASERASGLRIDPYGSECGEWLFQKCAGFQSKLGSDSPVYQLIAEPKQA